MDKTRFASIEQFKASLTNAYVEEQANGDLDGDGVDDWVGSIVREPGTLRKNGDAASNATRQIVVLRHVRPAGYVLADESLESEKDTMGTSESEFGSMSIANGEFGFKFRNSWHGCSSSTEYHFKLEDGRWRLTTAQYIEIYNGDGGNRYHELGVHKNMTAYEERVTLDGVLKARYKTRARKYLLKDYTDGYEGLFEFRHGPRSVC